MGRLWARRDCQNVMAGFMVRPIFTDDVHFFTFLKAHCSAWFFHYFDLVKSPSYVGN